VKNDVTEESSGLIFSQRTLLSFTQTKIEFIWDERCPHAQAGGGALTFRPVDNAEATGVFAHAVRQCLAGSLDTADQHAIAAKGLDGVVRGYVWPNPVFAFDKAWWRLAYNAADELVGFTQPVIFREGERDDGLQEGSLHFIGVLPAHRGKGYIDELLAEATTTLHGVGVWRIYCDTDQHNTPMISAFERAGYRRGKLRNLP
jgi:ribosomal protein S18 acetylase RimI-like enzyme